MYPRLSDFVNDMLGTKVEWPVQSYGFFLATAFVAGAWFLRLELKRGETQGSIRGRVSKTTNSRSGLLDYAVSFLVGFIIGFKVYLLATDYNTFVEDPQSALFSMKGNVFAGFLLAAAMVGWTYYTDHRSRNKMVSDQFIHPYELTPVIVLIAAVTGILGAKLFHILENLQAFAGNPAGMLFTFDGLTFYGGLLTAAFAVAWYGQKNGIHWRQLGDMIAPSLILAYGIGRIGCQFAGDGDWGIVNTMPKPAWLILIPDWLWAYHYPHNILGEGIPIAGCTGRYCFQLEQPVFPTPVYETIMSLAIFAILWLIRKRLAVPGKLFAVYLILNGMERFLIEQIRINNTLDLFGIMVTQAQLISTGLILTGIVLLVIFQKHPEIKSMPS
ncbi:MAG: prolipoprotein diacylglyceryl transferase [Bacteroidales bacterium]|nr:prolipoprotein diacylglyceryl transferase [Bacteroidales bacterium]